MKKIFTILTLILLCLGLCAANIFGESLAPDKEPNQPAYLKTIPSDKLKEDLDFLFKTIEEVHPNMYAYTLKEEFNLLREQLYKKINRPMNRLEFYKLAAPVVAAVKNSHTAIQPFTQEFTNYFKGGGKVFPLELRWYGSKFILSKDYSSASLPVGGEVLTINGNSVGEIVASFSRLFAAENRSTNPQLITENTNALRLWLWLEYGPVESWDLKIRSNDGKVNSYTIKSIAATELEGREATADPASKYSYQYFPKYDTSLLEINSFGGFEGDLRGFKEFLSESFQKIRKQKVTDLIIDVRENEGGHDNLVSHLMEYLTSKPYRMYEKTEIKISVQSRTIIKHHRRNFPNKFANKKEGDIITLELPLYTPSANPFRFNGRVFALIGHRTFSASTVFASTVKCFHVGTLVGEETPDSPTLYGSCIKSKLPNSELELFVASNYLVAACGKSDGRGVLPDYEVKQKPEDTAKGIDTVMEFTLNLIKSGQTALNKDKMNK